MPLVSSPANKIEIYHFNPLVLILSPLLALVVQTYLPLYVTSASLLDLPLLVVIYFGLARRNPIEGIFGGAVIGMAQDGLSRGPIGLLGSAKTVIGYVTSFVSVRFAVEHIGVRSITIFILYHLQFFLLYFFGTLMLGQPMALTWSSRLVAALVNTVVGVLLFQLLDRFRKPA
jgi:rod shape-determining protein MreD